MKICPACSRELEDAHETCPDDGVVLVHLDTDAGERPDEVVGTVIDGRYRIERIVGRGGMGTIYACRHVVVGRAFAMKVLRPGIERSEEVLQRFIREAQTANSIESRHICQMTDFGQLRGRGGAFYVVMELLEGMSLTRALREKRLSPADSRHVFIQVADTLQKAHDAGIVHRDLKPDNVVLVRDGNDPHFVKLVDFGIAKVMSSKAGELTDTGVILGTPYYMSPEQARGDPLDARSDIYALGVMMYRAFTGRLPFVADSAMGVLTRHLHEQPERPSAIRNVDPRLERLIVRCLEKKPIDRFQRMEQVAEALRRLEAEPTTSSELVQTRDERSAERPASEADATRLDTPAAGREADSITQVKPPSIPPPAAPPELSAIEAGTSASRTGERAGHASEPPAEPRPYEHAVPSFPPPPSHPPPDGYPGETNRGLVSAPLHSLSPPDHGRRVAIIGGGAAILVTIGALAAIALVEPPRRTPTSPHRAPSQQTPPEPSSHAEREAGNAPSEPRATSEAPDETSDEPDDTSRDEPDDTGGDRDETAAPKPPPHASPPAPPPRATGEPASTATTAPPPSPAYDDGVRDPFE